MARPIDDRWLLPIEGLVSGVLTSLISLYLVSQLPHAMGALLLGVLILWSLGLVFGVMIATHVHFFRGVDSLHRLVGFVATCMVAYPVAFFSMRLTPFPPEFLNLSGAAPGAIDSSSFFFPGFVGSVVVCAGVLLFLVSPESLTLRQLTTLPLKALGGSVVCGVLGVLGWAFGERVAIPAWLPVSHDSLAYFALPAILQMGAASLVGFLMPQEAAPVAAQPAARPGLLELKAGRGAQSAAAAALLLLTCGTLIGYMTIREYVAERRYLAAQRQAAAERPSLNHLPAIVAPPVGQVLLLKAISGYLPGRQYVSKSRQEVETASYMVDYNRPNMPEGQALFADADIDFYPTPEWAVYSIKQVERISVSRNPNAVETVLKFGNKVIRDAWLWKPKGGGFLNFYWASGSRVVTVTYLAAEDDEFLKEYLARYPSTL